MSKAVQLTVVIERKDPRVPRFVVIPAEAIQDWKLTGTTTITGTLKGVDMGRRGLKPWGDSRWFIDLPERLCRKASVDTGHYAEVAIEVAPDVECVELTDLIAKNPAAKRTWDRLTPGNQRMLREYVLSAKQPATRAARAAKQLGV